MKIVVELNTVQGQLIQFLIENSRPPRLIRSYLRRGCGIDLKDDQQFAYNPKTMKLTYDDGKKKEKHMIQKLKNLDMERMDLDEAIELLTVANSIRVTYDAEQVEIPEWVDTSVRELKREIRARQQDSRERRLKELKSRREALATTEEKRAKIEKEIAELEALNK